MGDGPRFRPDADYHDEDWLREQLREKGRTPPDIADDFDVTSKSVRKAAEKHGISTERAYTQKEWLRRKHHDEGMEVEEIAEMTGVTKSTIANHMRRKGVERWDKHSHGSDSGSEGKKRIEVEPEHFEKLKGEKPEGVPWGEYLAQMRTMD